MTVCLYLDGGVPIIITDTLQSRPGMVVYSPENCDFVEQQGQLKALRSNGDGERDLMIGRYPLTRKWKLFDDNVVIAFSGPRAEVDRLIRDYGEYIANPDGSGAVVEKLRELRHAPGSPRIGFTVVAPTSDRFFGQASANPERFWPYEYGQAVGTGAGYMHFMYHAWLHTQIGTRIHLGDRDNYLIMAHDFVTWLNGIHVTSTAPYALRRYRKRGGRTFGGFFQGIYYSPEDGRWFDLRRADLVSYARVSKDRRGRRWICRKLVREVRGDLNREVHVTFRDRDGSPTTEVFPIQDAFGDFEGFQGLNLPFPANVAIVGVDGLKVVQVEPDAVRVAEDMTISLSEPLVTRLEAEIAASLNGLPWNP